MDDGQARALDATLSCAFRYALALARNPGVAEDLVQEACVSVLRTEQPLTEQNLIVAVRSRWIDSGRRAKARLRLVGALRGLAASSGQARSAGDGGDDENHERLAAALATLRDIEREALYLFYARGFSATETALLTGSTKGSVVSLLARARLKLKRALQSQGGEA